MTRSDALVEAPATSEALPPPHQHKWRYGYVATRHDIVGLRQTVVASRVCDGCGHRQVLVPLEQSRVVNRAAWADEHLSPTRGKPPPARFDLSFQPEGPAPVDEVSGDDADVWRAPP